MSSEPAESTEFWNGFMPTNPPITRLPSEWESWEAVLEVAMNDGLQLGNRLGITEEEKQTSERWRLRVRELPIITKPQDPEHIHRVRLVLVWILHFYVHTLPPQSDSEPVRIPPSLSVPLLQISKTTDQPPVLTYADGVILNSYLDATHNEPKCLFLFNKGPRSAYEQAFHLTSAQVEWEGAKAMRVVHDIVTSSADTQTLASQLETLTTHIHTLHETLLFYQEDLRSGLLLQLCSTLVGWWDLGI
ncbi:indoleamine 2, 3-dioxyganeseb [Moniliophthora roreri MCA 2997]|uniref:Indoleamine 2, 3-dioxyganeseb n=1 Tax=Moniliophthora roreri (strain MCA 2997) TaxID=1381753 RepID=V2WM84_MONRO|nr:indoleamine 2, 3-dioxyganeseb [Moniliophthora roreri MCA 2997]